MTEAPKDADLSRYLLAESTDEEQSSLEEQFFTNDEVFDRLLEAEADLVDAYARGELPPAAHAAFEKRLSVSPGLRERAEIARALGNLPLASRSTSKRNLVFATAAALLLALGGAWLAIDSLHLGRERGDLLTERQSLRGRISRLEQAAGEQQTRLTELTRELERRSEGAPATSAPARIVSFVLATGLTRGGSASNRLVVPKDAEVLVLDLPLEEHEYRRYRVTIETADGRAVAVLRGLQPRTMGSNVLRVSLSPSLFPPGDYILTLAREKGAAAEPVAEYAFRVAR